jgi:hypothetical protein
MNLKMILSAASAAALLTAGAAQAQTAYGTAQGEMNTQAGPSDHKDSSTGLPSVDSTRPTGAEAGKTMSGDMSAEAGMESDMSGAVNAPGAVASGDATAATQAGTMASATTAGSASTQVVTNGPIPDTEENRAKYGGPQSRAGKMSDPSGN